MSRLQELAEKYHVEPEMHILTRSAQRIEVIEAAPGGDVSAKEAEAPMDLTAYISTGVTDRDKEVLTPSGAMLDDYRKNPIVLWAHKYDGLALAVARWIKTDKKGLLARVHFDAEYDLARQVFGQFKRGFLRAFSVGFLQIENHEPTAEENEEKGWGDVQRVHDKWLLLEFSAVPVPSNPEALALAISKGLAVPEELAAHPDVSREVEHIKTSVAMSGDFYDWPSDSEPEVKAQPSAPSEEPDAWGSEHANDDLRKREERRTALEKKLITQVDMEAIARGVIDGAVARAVAKRRG